MTEETTLHLKVDKALAEKAERLVPLYRAAHPGLRVNRPDLLRYALHRGLADLERDLHDEQS